MDAWRFRNAESCLVPLFFLSLNVSNEGKAESMTNFQRKTKAQKKNNFHLNFIVDQSSVRNSVLVLFLYPPHISQRFRSFCVQFFRNSSGNPVQRWWQMVPMALSKIKFSLICLVDQIRKDASGRNQIPAGIFFFLSETTSLSQSSRVIRKSWFFFHKKKNKLSEMSWILFENFVKQFQLEHKWKIGQKQKKKKENLTVQPSTCHKHTQVLDVSNEWTRAGDLKQFQNRKQQVSLQFIQKTVKP